MANGANGKCAQSNGDALPGVRRQGVGTPLRRAQLRRVPRLFQAQHSQVTSECYATPYVRKPLTNFHQRNLDYLCKESNQCVVDVSRRNQCQACRFRRCLEVNMKRDGTLYYCLMLEI